MAENHGGGSHKPKRVSSVAKHKTKTIKIKHHHTRAYRKRHYGALVLSIFLAFAAFSSLIVYRNQVNQGIDSAQAYLSGLFDETPTEQTVSSTYGFSLQYDVRRFYASALDTVTGDLFLGQELSTYRAYEKVRISTGSIYDRDSQRTMTVSYYDDVKVSDLSDQKLKNLEKTLLNDGINTASSTVVAESTNKTSIGGIDFTVSDWLAQPKDSGILAKFSVSFTTYAGILDGHPIVIKISHGLASNDRDTFKDVLDSIVFGSSQQSYIQKTEPLATKLSSNRNLIDSVLFTQIASAATAVADSSEQNSSRYSPAVVKIYNVYCMDISVEAKPYLTGVCSGSTGSGFFINSSGHIATNGHVASADPKDIIISDAVNMLVKGDTRYFKYIASVAGVVDADIAGAKSNNEAIEIIVDKMYKIDDSKITVTNNVTNLLVGLNEKQPDIEELLKVTKARQSYPEQDSVKAAKVVDKDYRVIDGITQFKSSDVAIIKIEGSNYPVTKLGSIDGLSQGASLLILGYPGSAGNNGLVESSESKPTLTSGKVSAVKSAKGSEKKLIETDTTIGHGNSGGPAFDSTGNVVGIATYTVAGAGEGNGTFNYVRDIKDLKDLASKASVTIDPKSATQTEWDKGIDLFYNSRYSKAVKSFSKVKSLYPAHPKADELIAVANERIKSGQDIKDFPYLIVVIAVASLGGIGASVMFITRHRKAHTVYKGNLASGAMTPMTPGMPAQNVTYNPADYQIAPQQSAAASPVPQPITPNAVAPQPTETIITPTNGQLPR